MCCLFPVLRSKHNSIPLESSQNVEVYCDFNYNQVMQLAGVEGEQVYLLLEDHQVTNIAFLDMVNSLLSSGEVS
jgi:dynein heavy chain 2